MNHHIPKNMMHGFAKNATSSWKTDARMKHAIFARGDPIVQTKWKMMKFSDKAHFDPVPKIVRGRVIDHEGRTCAEVLRLMMEEFKRVEQITVRHKDGSLEVFNKEK